MAGYGYLTLSSTEILVSGSKSWVTISPLPISVYNLRTVNYENTILAFGSLSLTIDIHQNYLFLIISGGLDGGNLCPYDTIYQFHPSNETWSLFGSLKYSRFRHAVDLVIHDDFVKYCRSPSSRPLSQPCPFQSPPLP